MEPAHPPRPVVIVDDNEDDAFLLERAIRRGGFGNPVVKILGPQGALRYFELICESKETVPLILFLDVNLYCWNGTTLAAWIRASPLGSSFPVVMISGSQDPLDVELARRAGADCYWLKPAAAGRVADLLSAASAESPFRSSGAFDRQDNLLWTPPKVPPAGAFP